MIRYMILFAPKEVTHYMITKNDLAAIDTYYFDVIGVKEYSIELRSKNTGHYWYLLERVYNGQRSFLIHHKHSVTKQYHPQKSRQFIYSCCDYIKDHDAFHLERVKKKKERKLKTNRTK